MNHHLFSPKYLTKALIKYAFVGLVACRPDSSISEQALAAPTAPKQDSVLSIHGDTRVDAYFWMRLTDEQKNAKQPDAQTQRVLQYLEDENHYTETVMQDTENLQEELYQEIVERVDPEEKSVPYFKNGYWYYTRYEEGKEYPIYVRKQGSQDAPEEILLDVNERAEGYGYYDAAGLTVSSDNRLLAFAEDTLSRRIYTTRFKDLTTGEMLPDKISNTQPGGAWAGDHQSYFYATKDTITLLSNRIWRHQLGNAVTDDELKYEEKDPAFYMGVTKSTSDEYIIIWEQSTLANDYHLLKADQPDGSFERFTPREAEHLYQIEHIGDKFYVLTDWEAPNYRLMEAPVGATARPQWQELVPHRDSVLLEYIDVFNDYLVLSEKSDALPRLRVMSRQTNEEHYISFDEPAYVVYTTNNREHDTETLRYAYESMTTPTSVYDYNLRTHESTLLKQEQVIGGHNPDEYVTERLMVPSRDSVQVPVSLVYKKGARKDGDTPLLLYAYGSYGYATDPSFGISRLSLLDRGFIYAIAHVRGGQDMGRQWYEDGKMFNKKNTFTDFIDVAQHLTKEGYTSPEHLYAAGGSAGGLLMGAVANMAPEQFNGIVAAVPFVDVVSTMMDESIPLTTGEFDEWGDPKDLESYQYMRSYSPYDNVQQQDYPNMLVTTGLFDSQVQYWEPAKWVAKLREHKTDDNLLLLETNMEAGHGGSSGRYQQHRETALEYAFLLKLEDQIAPVN